MRNMAQLSSAIPKKEELLSVRVATPLNVESEKGGQIVNSRGGKSASKKDEKNVWGKRAEWCDYSGKLDNVSRRNCHFGSPNESRFTDLLACSQLRIDYSKSFGKSHFVFPLLKGTYRMAMMSIPFGDICSIVHDDTPAMAKNRGTLETIPTNKIKE